MTCRIGQKELQRWFIYDELSGKFFWRERPPKSKVSVGNEAGSVQEHHGRRRRILWVAGRRIYGSRAAFIYAHGDIPDDVLVDHADGDTLNDAIANLRIASPAQNAWNRLGRQGSSFLKGVSKDERGRFKARIQLPSGIKANLGTWATEAEAHAAYMGAAAVLHSEFWLGARLAENGGGASQLPASGTLVPRSTFRDRR